MLSGQTSLLGSTRRESRKRRRVSERHRMYNCQGVTSLGGPTLNTSKSPGMNLTERRRSSILTSEGLTSKRADSPLPGALGGTGVGGGDQNKIVMKIQFHITVAPESEPLILDHSSQLAAQHEMLSANMTAGNGTTRTNETISGEMNLTEEQQRRKTSAESTSISEHINERLSRQNSSTKRRQQLLAMHQQTALDGQTNMNATTTNSSHQSQPHSADDLRRHHHLRSGSTSAVNADLNANTTSSLSAVVGAQPLAGSREVGLRSSTITGGMQDEATIRFLARQQQPRQGSGSLTSTSASSLLCQHQTLTMASNRNIRQRLEEREHIYFKRDGQRFGHEFTLKLAVDKSYRCLIKVRPLIPIQSISVQGHHVSFVDCSHGGGGASSMTGSLNFLSGSNNTSSGSSSGYASSPSCRFNSTTRHQSIGNLQINNHSTIKRHQNSRSSNASSQYQANNASTVSPLATSANTNHQSSVHRASVAQQTLISAQKRLLEQNSDLSTSSTTASQLHQNWTSMSSLSLTSQQQSQLQKHLIKQQQHNQMMRHFSAPHCSGALSSSQFSSQLVYMFDWSAAGRFEVNKNKARTQVQTTIKFKNGELLSLPLQVKFYQPECRQHLSWGSQLHFIDYECQINSMGQISVDKVQYY